MTWERNLVILGMVVIGVVALAVQWSTYAAGIIGGGWLVLAIVYALLTGAKKWL